MLQKLIIQVIYTFTQINSDYRTSKLLNCAYHMQYLLSNLLALRSVT